MIDASNKRSNFSGEEVSCCIKNIIKKKSAMFYLFLKYVQLIIHIFYIQLHNGRGIKKIFCGYNVRGGEEGVKRV